MSADRIKDYGLVAYLIVLGGQVKLNEDGKSYCYLGTEFEKHQQNYRLDYKDLVDRITKVKKSLTKATPK